EPRPATRFRSARRRPPRHRRAGRRRPRPDRRRHRPHRHVRLGSGAAAPGRRPDRAGHRHRPPSLRPGRARLDEDGVPAGRCPRPLGTGRGVRRRRRGGAPGVSHHRQRLPRDHPGDQRRRHPQRLPGRRGGGSEPVRLRLVGGGVRLARRQPGVHHRGLAHPARRPAVLRPGEGRARGAAGRRGAGAPRPGVVPAASPGRRGARRHRRKGRPPRAAGPAGPRAVQPAAALPRAVPGVRAGTADAAHPRGGRRPRAGAVHRGGRASRRLQHRRRRRPDRCRRRPRVRRHPDPAPRGTGAGRRQGVLPPAAAAARRGVGGGGEPPGDHGHHQGPREAGLASALQRPGSPARHPAREPEPVL
ncbi:MAG: NAD-dependent epimerase/dehydratase, partial [uncultured Blastococcus sp.]